jgi:hypothetical protein
MSKRIARIIGLEITRLKAGEKPAIRVALPNPEENKSEIHWPENESEKEVDPVEADENANDKKTGIVAEKIPPPDDRVKDFAVALTVFIGEARGDGASVEHCFHLRV